VAYPVALVVVPIGWWLFGRSRIAYPVGADILLRLPFLIDVAGNALDLYDTIEWWDDANHLVNWALHTSPWRSCCGRDRGVTERAWHWRSVGP
jgi:hypothetical protein